MTADEAGELQGVLSSGQARIPGSEVAVTPVPGGADIVAIVDGTEHRFRIDDGDSAVIRVLLGGKLLLTGALAGGRR